MFFPINSNNGLICANVASLPPTMIVSDAAFAPTSPPDTGASRYSQPSALIFFANALVASGEIELMSTTIFPSDRPVATPCSPNRTSSTCGVSGTIAKMISDFCATSLACVQPMPPASISTFGTPLRLCKKTR